MKHLLSLILLVALSSPIQAQLISIKTVPVATGDQFLLFPSRNLGMGGLSIGLEDPLLDPYHNPARGAYVTQARVFTTPLFYTISMSNGDGNGGSARTIPVSLISNENHRFGGALLAFQQLTVTQEQNFFFFDNVFANTTRRHPIRRTDVLDNVYGMMMGGIQTEDERLAAGMSMTAARLNGLEGVRMLYWQGDDVAQDGHMLEFRLGLTAKPAEDKTFDMVLVHHRFAVAHAFVNSERTEEDETNGIGLDIGYRQYLEDGWQVGGKLTGDWQWHPKIPNYDLMQIPRDPGNTSAYNLGLGIARIIDHTTFGLDLIYEPIRSHTWANALEDIVVTNGFAGTSHVIPTGAKTIENFFRFNNRVIRAGVLQTGERVDFQFGLNFHTIRYDLDQTSYVDQFARSQSEKWTEWTLSGGLALHFSALEVRYLGRLLLGTGQPGVNSCGRCAVLENGFSRDANFLVAPSGNLIVNEARILTHQFTISLPLAAR